MSILVTGGAGYIGSVTVERLRAQGEEVVVLDDLFRGHRAAIASDIPFYQGRVGDRALVQRIAREHRVDSCVHFAALTDVRESVAKPHLYFENNVEQGIAFFGALLEGGVRRVVLSSTCAIYGDPERMPISEQTPQWPKNPYGWSKLTLERLLDSYAAAYEMKFVALRYFNAAGATKNCGEHHEPETHLIPNVLAAAMGQRPEVAVFGERHATPDGTPIRDYVHVSDLAEAHTLALDSLRSGGSSNYLNLGTGRGYSVLEIIEAARRVTGREIRVRIEPPRSGDAPQLVADSREAKKALGWIPRESDLTSILESAWAWKLQHPHGYSSASAAG